MTDRVTEAPVDPQFVQRWSPRAFSGEALTLEQLQSIFEAARWAPSCFNSQPWRLIYALQGGTGWEALFGLLVEGNQAWAQRAGALVAVASKDSDDRDRPLPTHAFDAGSAWMSMALQAQSMGLISHAMWGFHHDQANATLALPDGYAVQAVVAFGTQGDAGLLPENFREREAPSPRKAIADFAFEGTFRAEAVQL